MNKPNIVINEVGLRDGLQNQSVFISTADKLHLFRALIKAGIKHLEVSSFVSPRAVPQMADAGKLFDAILPSPDAHVYTALVPNMKGYQLAKAHDVESMTLVLASTDTFNRQNMGFSLNEAIDQCQQVLRAASEDGIVASVYIATACGCPYEGEVSVAEVLRLSELMIKAGARELIVADTIGAGNPRQIRKLLKPLLHRYPVEQLKLHLHDTQGQALAMATTALELGTFKFDSSIAGLGGCPFAPGASGNLATEDLVFMLHERGYETGLDFELLQDSVALVQRLIGDKNEARISG